MTATNRPNESLALSKKVTYLRGFLQGRGYFNAVKALEAILEHQAFPRSNGDPYYSHSVQVAMNLLPFINSIKDSELVSDILVAALMHDVTEDLQMTPERLRSEYGDHPADIVFHLDKNNFRNDQGEKDKGVWMKEMIACMAACLIKGSDNSNNLSTMLGFPIPKREKFINDTVNHVIPAVRAARKSFPEHYALLQHFLNDLRTQVMYHRHILELEHRLALIDPKFVSPVREEPQDDQPADGPSHS